MEINDLLVEIRTFLSANTDEERVKKYAYYFKEGFDAYGCHQDLLFEKKDELLARYKDEIGLEGFLELGNFLFDSGKYEEGSLAVLFLLGFKKQYGRNSFEAISRWLDGGIRNWAHTDYVCNEPMALHFKKELCSLEDMILWRESPNKWKRRAVPVSMLYFVKSGIDASILMEIIRPMMLDTERVVHQGLGWLLREAWKKQPAIIEPFLMEHKDTSARLIFQYATEKMTKEYREKFRAAKKIKQKA